MIFPFTFIVITCGSMNTYGFMFAVIKTLFLGSLMKRDADFSNSPIKGQSFFYAFFIGTPARAKKSFSICSTKIDFVVSL